MNKPDEAWETVQVLDFFLKKKAALKNLHFMFLYYKVEGHRVKSRYMYYFMQKHIQGQLIRI